MENKIQNEQTIFLPKPRKGATIASIVFLVIGACIFGATFIFSHILMVGDEAALLMLAILLPAILILYGISFISEVLAFIFSIKSIKNTKHFKNKKRLSIFLLVLSIILLIAIGFVTISLF